MPTGSQGNAEMFCPIVSITSLPPQTSRNSDNAITSRSASSASPRRTAAGTALVSISTAIWAPAR